MRCTVRAMLVVLAGLMLAGCQQQAIPPTPPATATAPTTSAASTAPVPAAQPGPPVASRAATAAAGAIPQAALAYRSELIRTARAVWGMDAPVAAFGAQVHQESGWRADAVSGVGAAGLAQFMPATSKWISGLYSDLKDNQPYNPGWALRALVLYDQWLFARTPTGYAEFDRMWVALRAYNGGLGHWQLEARNAATPDRVAVDQACGTAKRARVHCTENLGYPQRILVTLQPRYLAWGRGV